MFRWWHSTHVLGHQLLVLGGRSLSARQEPSLVLIDLDGAGAMGNDGFVFNTAVYDSPHDLPTPELQAQAGDALRLVDRVRCVSPPSCAWALLRGRLYCHGGVVHGEPTAQLVVHDAETGVVLEEPQLAASACPSPRSSHAMCAVDDRHLVLHGGDGQFGLLNDWWLYDTDAHVWTQVLPPFPNVSARMGHCLASYQGQLLVSGGYGGKALSVIPLRLSIARLLAAPHAPPAAPAPPPVLAVPAHTTEASEGSSTLTVECYTAGVVVLRQFLATAAEQQAVVDRVEALCEAEGGLWQPHYDDGRAMHCHVCSLGRWWDIDRGEYTTRRPPQTRTTVLRSLRTDLPPVTATAADSAAAEEDERREVAAVPDDLQRLVQRCVKLAQQHDRSLPNTVTDLCVVNFYQPWQRGLKVHQDKEERPETLAAGKPVVSFSFGDAADFLYSAERPPPCDTEATLRQHMHAIRLRSGDVLLFGGPARLCYHAVCALPAEEAQRPPDLVLRPGRLNLTFRES